MAPRKDGKGIHKVSGKVVIINTKAYASGVPESRRKKITQAFKQRKKVPFNTENNPAWLQTSPWLHVMPEDIEKKSHQSPKGKEVGLGIIIPSSVVLQTYRGWADTPTEQGYKGDSTQESLLKG